MINIVIIEDEAPARRKLHRFLRELDEETTVLAECESVIEAIEYLGNNTNEVHLILSDISLRDGNAFAIYEQVADLPPIIFLTAYDEYLMNAFETNGIAYLLKPYTSDQFRNAWQKFLRLRNSPTDHNTLLDKLRNLLQAGAKRVYKTRFSCNSGKGTIFLETSAICYFVAEESVVFAVDTHNQKYILSQDSLKEVFKQLDPVQFFQINRGELVNIKFVERLERYGKNSIAIKLRGTSNYLVTSQSKTAAFRAWIDQ